MSFRPSSSVLIDAFAGLLFYGGLLLLLMILMVMVLGSIGGLPTGPGYVGAVNWRAPLIPAAVAISGAVLRRTVRNRRKFRS